MTERAHPYQAGAQTPMDQPTDLKLTKRERGAIAYLIRKLSYSDIERLVSPEWDAYETQNALKALSNQL